MKLQNYEKALKKALKPPDKILVSEWAERERVLSSESSAEAGQWKNSRAPYQKEMMDVINDPEIEQVVFMTGSQIGKTEIINNLIGFFMAVDPAPMLVVQPTLEMAENWSKARLANMIRDTPVLSGLVADHRARDSGNTLTHKEFRGGSISICGANSPAGLASRAIRILCLDEVDRFPQSAGAEGDPVSLAIRRTATFWNRKIIMVSTPTIKGISRIEIAYNESDKRQYYIPCPFCGVKQILKWAGVKWENSDPSTAHYECSECKKKWTNGQRISALHEGEWIASNPSSKIAGFALSGLYSPWTSLQAAVENFLSAKEHAESLKTFVNTFLGEVWEEDGEHIDDNGLYNRREVYDYDVPTGVILLVAGVDVQDDRLEIEVLGIGLKEESWSISHEIIYGDPSTPQLWEDLEHVLFKRYMRDKTPFRIACTCIDSGGHYAQAVYAFAKKHMARRVYAIKGMAGMGRAPVTRPSKNNLGRVNLFTLGVDALKKTVYSRLKILESGAGFCHFPENYDAEYFAQLTAEKIIVRYHKGFARQEWVKVRARNEALDLRAYALAAYIILNVQDISKIKIKEVEEEKPEQKIEIKHPQKQIKRQITRKPQRASWVLS